MGTDKNIKLHIVTDIKISNITSIIMNTASCAMKEIENVSEVYEEPAEEESADEEPADEPDTAAADDDAADEEGGDKEDEGADRDQEEEEEEEDAVDPMDTLREKCRSTQKCRDLMARYEECTDRVNSRSETEENCSEEMLDFFECQDQCMAKDLFRHLK